MHSPSTNTPGPDQDADVQFFYDGQAITAQRGQSVAAALCDAGIRNLAPASEKQGRGVFCGMGVCNECIVTVNHVSSQRSCMTLVENNMQVSSQAARPDISALQTATITPPPTTIPDRETDILVVGAGPAGLAAATMAARAGAQVIMVDDRSAPGGQYFKQPSSGPAQQQFKHDPQTSAGARLIAQTRDAGAQIQAKTVVWGAERQSDGRLKVGLYGPDGAFYLYPKALVIATGAYERPDPVPGWTLPGVMTTGAAQTFLRSYGTPPGKQIIIAGNGPLNLQVASELRKIGANIVAVLDAAPSPWQQPVKLMHLVKSGARLALQGARQISALRLGGVPVLWGSRITHIVGDEKGAVQTVEITSPEGRHTFNADTVLLGGGFTSSNELSRLLGCGHDVVNGQLIAQRDVTGKTTLDDVYSIGEAAQFGGAHIALAQGKLTGAAIAQKLGFDANTDGLEAKLNRHRAFQTALWSLYNANDAVVTDLPGETEICRCEKVTLQTLSDLAKTACDDVATLKRLSRAGMGRCQGRYCSHNVQAISNANHNSYPTRPKRQTNEKTGFLAPQMPLRPVPLAALAREKPEWGGHKRSHLPQNPPLYCADPLPVSHTETLVIGAGIAGISTALFLARAGREVVVIDKAYPNSLASGGNAGSLHAQLLSFDHGARSEGGGTPAQQTLPLQRDSIQLWAELQNDLAADFEMKITGGIMVAENDRDMQFLEAKTRAERSMGVECHVIGKDDLFALEPALSRRFVGAAYCPQEGKINPLVATQCVLDAARTAGATIFDRTEVTQIEKTGAFFEVTTSRGKIRAKNIVNAAGAYAARIGNMLGLDVPVFGAPLQMVVTEAVAPLIGCLVAHADRHLTLKQASNGNFIIGGGWTAGLDPVHQHPRPLIDSLEGNLWVAQHVVPALRKLHIIRSWAAMNINIDGAPILGEHPDQPGFFNAVTSNGYTLGPLVGHITAALISRPGSSART
jgi:glycine/D-amino acid oxidase-like deaminating enzyme